MARTRTPGRREALLAAAQRVLSTQGVEKATIDEVTAAAGMAKGTFYLYFQSKSDLVAAMRREFAAELAERVAGSITSEGPHDWPGTIRQLLESAADSYLANLPLHEAVLYHGDAGEGEAGWTAEIVRALEGFITAGSKAGAFTVDDPEFTAVLLFDAIHGLFHHALHQPQGPDRQRVVDAAWQLSVRALSCQDSGHGAS